MNKKFLGGFFLLFGLAIIILFIYIFKFLDTSKSEKDALDAVKTISQDIMTPTEVPNDSLSEKSKIAINETTNLAAATFEKVENSVIFYKMGGEIVSLPFTKDEVAIACTKQNLDNATELDYGLVSMIKQLNPEEINSILPNDLPIVAFTFDDNGTKKVHTIAVSEASCPK